jgi:hypothetical protein
MQIEWDSEAELLRVNDGKSLGNWKVQADRRLGQRQTGEEEKENRVGEESEGNEVKWLADFHSGNGGRGVGESKQQARLLADRIIV